MHAMLFFIRYAPFFCANSTFVLKNPTGMLVSPGGYAVPTPAASADFYRSLFALYEGKMSGYVCSSCPRVRRTRVACNGTCSVFVCRTLVACNGTCSVFVCIAGSAFVSAYFHRFLVRSRCACIHPVMSQRVLLSALHEATCLPKVIPQIDLTVFDMLFCLVCVHAYCTGTRSIS
jgi:hypothetical protein